MGQQWKWGAGPGSTTIFENNFTVGNCRRMSEPLPGAPAGFNRHLTDFCRAAGDVFSFFTAPNSNVLFANNTTVGDSATMFDIGCERSGPCTSTPFVFRNNIVLGYVSSRGSSEAPNLFYFSAPTVKIDSDHDIFFGLRSRPCGFMARSSLICQSPDFVDQPPLSIKSEAQLDNFNFHPARTSPAVAHGQAVDGISTDFFGAARPNPPAIGAAEPGR